MDDENKKIYINKDEEIPSIIMKINKHKEKDVILVVSRENVILQSLINLKILKKKVEEMGKTVSVIKTDSEIKEREIAESIRNSSDFVNVHGRQVGSIRKNMDTKSNTDELNRKRSDENITKVHKINTDSNVNEYLNQNNNGNKVKMFDIVKKMEDNTSADTLEKPPLKTIKMDPSSIKKGLGDAKNNESRAKIISNKGAGFLKPKEGAKKTMLIPSINSKMFSLFILIILATVALVIAFILPKADIRIILKTEPVSYDFEFLTDETLDNIDFANNKIPLEKIEIIGQESEEYPTKGKKHLQEKASGEITVFNEYSSNPQRIVANTRFLSKDSNKLFKVKEAVTIPGFSRVEGVDVPGQVKIKVYADKIGEDHNIGNSSFYLPGLQGTAKYTSIYARSIKPMSGGIDKEVSYFSESDYITAKENLLKLAKEKNVSDFESKISEQSILLEETRKDEDVEIETDVEIGDIADKFEMKITVKNSVAIINRGDLEKIIDEKISSKLDANKSLLKNSRIYNVREIIIDDDDRINIFVDVKQDVIENIDVDNLKFEIVNKDEENLKSYFRNINGIKSTDISLWPFWVKKIPSSYEKINITIDINDSI